MKLKFKKLNSNVKTPVYATEHSGCFDIYAYALNNKQDAITLSDENQTLICSTGLFFEIPEDYVLLIFSRSGHGFKNDTRLANCVGVIDADYRGELLVKLSFDDKLSQNSLTINVGDRIAQGLIVHRPKIQFEEVETLSETVRGTGGFGSTGKS